MTMLKKNGGFTLVELIVVIAILAILAAVSVPAYTGYINKANDTAANTELRTVYIAAMAAAAHEGQNVNKITVSGDTITIDPTNADIEKLFDDFYSGDAGSLKAALEKHSTFKGNATWTKDDGWH